MNASNTDVIQALCQAISNQEVVYLATVLSTWGSSPRPPGAMMVWSERLGVTGSISGGCIEENLFARIKQGEFSTNMITLLRFGEQLNDSTELSHHSEDISLPCGGTLNIALERFDGRRKNRKEDHWKEILAQLNNRRGLKREVNLVTGEWSWQAGDPFALECHRDTLVQYIGPTRKLLIVGANQVSWYLASYAKTLDFNVSICDPSTELGPQWWNEEFSLLNTYPDGIIDRDFSDANSAIVAVSHDPRLDDMALLEGLPSQAFYIGAMGSLNTSNTRKQRLQNLDLPSTLINKLHAPIGLDIGSKTPAEIAMSIAAHLVQEYTKRKPQSNE